MNKRLLAVCFVVLFLCTTLPARTACRASAVKKTDMLRKNSISASKKILILHSYHKGLVWTDREDRGIVDTLRQNPDLSIFTEYLDTKRYKLSCMEKAFGEYLKVKYSENKPDLIICSDNNALNFLKKYHDLLFPRIPIVFCGINDFNKKMLKGFNAPITGVVENFDIPGTVELMGKLNPSLNRIIMLTGASRIADTVRVQAEKQLAGHKIKGKIEWWQGFSEEKLFSCLALLTVNDAVLFIVFTRDGKGHYCAYDKISSAVVKRSKAPVYVLFAQNIGTGTVGGKVISGINQGRKAAELALYLLKTGKALPVIKKSPNQIILDYKALVRSKLRLSGLDEPAIILNRPVSFYAKNRTIIWISATVFMGMIIAFIGIVYGLIKAKKSEAMFRILVEQSPVSIQIFNGAGLTVMANQAWSDLWQAPIDEVVNKYNVLDDRFLKTTQLYDELMEAFTGRAVMMSEVEYDPADIGKPGRKRIVKCIAFPIKYGEQIKRVVLMQQDITEQKMAEEETRLLHEQLNHRNKMNAIGQLAGGIAHDFNNMLSGIMGAAQMLQILQKNPDEKILRLINIILSASERAADLTAKLLAFGRKGKIESTKINVGKIINDTASILKSTIDKKISISVKHEAEDDTIVGDNSAMQNALMNLGINAAHAMPDGGDLIFQTENIKLDDNYCNACVFEITSGKYIEINVMDNGCGIKMEYLDRIFEPFFTTKEQGKGTGLGLAAVYGIVRDHHGAITVYSEEGSGTLFKILLPLAANSGEKSDQARNFDSIRKFNKKKDMTEKDKIAPAAGLILLIDDEEMVRVTVGYILSDMGYDVVTAENGFQAVQIFENRHDEIDCVICDMIMPKMNGRETFFKLKEIDPDCRIILSSGFTQDENLGDMRKAGLSAFIQKPFGSVELDKILKEVLS